MQGNRFEKEVRQKMDGFGLDPSSQIWEEVEKRIRKEKRKRRIIFWLFFFLLLSGGGITTGILFTKNRKDNIAEFNSKIEKHESPVLSKPQRTEKKKSFPGDLTPKKNDLNENDVKEQAKTNEKKSFVEKKPDVLNEKEAEKKKRKNLAGKKENKPVVPDSKIINNTQQIVDSSTVVNVESNEVVNTDEKDKIQKATGTITEVKNDTTEKRIEEPKKDSVTNNEKEEKSKPSVSVNKTKKWEWGLAAEGGLSQIVKGAGLFKGLLSGNSAFSYQSPTISGGTTTVSPTSIRQSVALSAGIFVQCSVSKKLNIDLGIGYSLFSTKMKVGNKVDSVILNFPGLGSLNSYYSGTNPNNSYTNHYNFLNITASLAWNISGKKEFYWKNGLTYSRLLFSDGLYFNKTYSIYFKDFSLFNKDHFFLSTGFSIPAGKKFNLNAFMKYDLVPLSHDANSSSTHLSYYGFGINFFPGKKK